MKNGIRSQGKRPICYVSGAIRGDTSYRARVLEIVGVVAEQAWPKTQLDPSYRDLLSYSDEELTPQVSERDIFWLDSAQCMVAEVSGPSTGTGWEVCYATRVARIPCLCLYESAAEPSLLILKDRSKYLVVRRYSSSDELKVIVRTFLSSVLQSNDIEKIRRGFFEATRDREAGGSEFALRDNAGDKAASDSLPSLTSDSSHREVVLTGQQQTVLDLAALGAEDWLMVAPAEGHAVDFRDRAEISAFLVRAFLAQSRWKRLRAQRIGRTFVSGSKPDLIQSLTRFARHSSLTKIYARLRKTLHYSSKAFSKNVRAFRAIGILENPQKPHFGSTRFKTNAYVIKTLQEEYKIRSSRPSPKRLRNVIIPTQFFIDLAGFLTTFGRDQMVVFLRAADRRIPDLSRATAEALHLDDSIERFLATDWGRQVFEVASLRVRSIWESAFSTSFAIEEQS